MLCGCSKMKKPPKGAPSIADDSGYGLLEEIPASNGVEISESWCPVLKCDHPMYPRRQQEKCSLTNHNQGFDSGVDTGSSPDSGHTNSHHTYGQSSSPDSGHIYSRICSPPVKVLDHYGSTKRLEVSERGSMGNLSGQTTKMFQIYRGQIKLSVYFNSGLLTMHVRHAKHLTSKWSAEPCAYVKVALIPDCSQSRCKTKTCIDTDRPHFDEKFSFELGDEDFEKRIFIAVCSKDPNHTKSELLGCMSFGLHNIIRGKTSVHGWYFLLSEQVGRRKHLQAHNKRNLLVNVEDYNSCFLSETTSCSEFSEGPHEDIVPDSSVLHMARGLDGYGFTLTGGCPSQVFTIEPESPAAKAGMRVGDTILEINGQDVYRAITNTVARIVRFHPEIYIRVQSTPTPIPSPWGHGRYANKSIISGIALLQNLTPVTLPSRGVPRRRISEVAPVKQSSNRGCSTSRGCSTNASPHGQTALRYS